MPTAAEISEYADTLLRTKEIVDYPSAVNGLQVATKANIRKIAAAVDFSSRTIAAAKAAGAQLLLVHHGAFWDGPQPLTGSRYKVFANLMAASIGVYASHLPLDCHPTLGNNVLLAERLGLQPNCGFGNLNGVAIGVGGESEEKIEKLVERAVAFAEEHGGVLRMTRCAERRAIGRWAILTGSGADRDTLNEATAGGVRTMVVGEGPHWTSVFAEENDIVLLYAGHYATETLGVQALAKAIATEFDIGWEFIPAPTGS